MATESVATSKDSPIPPISAWDLGQVEVMLKQIRGISMMGSSADAFNVDDARWAFYNLAETADEALKLISATERED